MSINKGVLIMLKTTVFYAELVLLTTTIIFIPLSLLAVLMAMDFALNLMFATIVVAAFYMMASSISGLIK